MAEKEVDESLREKLKVHPYKNSDDENWVEQHPGRPTGKHDRLIRLPVSWLIKLPGLRGEHKVLTLDMPKIQGMSKIVGDNGWQRANPVTLGVQHDGKVFVDDGNHRIRAAKVAGVESLLCRVKYFGGGENEFDIVDVLSKNASHNDLMNTFMQLQNSGVPWGDLFQKMIAPENTPALQSAVTTMKSKIPSFKKVSPQDAPMQQNAGKKQVMCFGAGCKSPAEGGGLLCAKCRSIPKEERELKGPREGKDLYMPEKHDQWWHENRRTNKREINKVFNLLDDILVVHADDQGISGATDLDGGPGDSYYDEVSSRGVDYGGENDPNKDDERMLTKDDEPMPFEGDGRISAALKVAFQLLSGFIDPVTPITNIDVRKTLKTNPKGAISAPEPNEKGSFIDVKAEFLNKALSLALKVIAEEKPSLDDTVFDNEGYAEAKHHLETNMGEKCKDANCKFHVTAKKFTDKEHRQHDHIVESEEERGMSPDEADDIAWATVNKQKHEANLVQSALKLASNLIKHESEYLTEDEAREVGRKFLEQHPDFWKELDKGKAPHKNDIEFNDNLNHWVHERMNHKAKDHKNAPLGSPECGAVCQMRHDGMTFEEAMAHANNQKKAACLDTFIKVIASSNKPCTTCGMPSDQCSCNDGTNMSPGYTQGGTQRKNLAPKVKPSMPKEMTMPKPSSL